MRQLVICMMMLFCASGFSQNFWQQTAAFGNMNGIEGRSIAKDYGGWGRIVYGGAGSCGCTFGTSDGGNTWENFGSPGGQILDMSLVTWSYPFILAAVNQVGLYRYRQQHWTSIGTFAGLNVRTVLAKSYLFAGVAGDASHRGVWRSLDENGDLWERNIQTASYDIYCSDYCSNKYYAGGAYGGAGILIRSEDGGTNWTDIGDFGWPVRGIAASEQGDVYVVVSRSSGPNVYLKSGNGGWQELTIPDGAIDFDRDYKAPIAVNSLGHVYIGDHYRGVFKSTDKGATWILINSGLDGNIKSSDLHVEPNSQYLYYAHAGNTMMRGYKSAAPTNQLTAPVIEPSGGTFPPPVSVTISSSETAPFTIRYTTNGTDPDASSNLYSGALSISGSSNVTLKARVFKDGYSLGPIASALYTYLAAPVLISPANNAVGVPVAPQLNWSSVEGSSGYHLQLASDPNFPQSSILIDEGSLSQNTFSLPAGALSNNTLYYWRVRAAFGGQYSAFSDPVFCFTTIQQQQPSVTLISPHGGETWAAGTSQEIAWSAENFTSVKIECSIDNGTSWQVITESTSAAAGSYIWTIPDNPSTNCKIRISRTGNTLPADTNDFVFAIVSGQINPCPGLPALQYEGRTYHTVLIGGQCWLKENLNAGVMINSTINQSNNGILEKYCYGNNEMNCSIYGGLYEWNEAMSYSRTPGVQGICPSGWHIPTMGDVGALVNTVQQNGNVLKERGQDGSGTNSTGFSALFGGWKRWNNEIFELLGEEINLWCSTEFSEAEGTGLILARHYDPTNLNWFGDKRFGMSIRCLKDAAVETLALLSPVGGETWNAGSTHPITWTSQNIDSIKIEFSSDNGNHWAIVNSNAAAAAGLWQWTVPNIITSTARIKLTALTQTSTTVTGNVFSISSPNGLIAWYPFSGNADDESGNGYHGTNNGSAVSADRFGQSGKAYSLDGLPSHYIMFPSAIQLPGTMSLSFWLRTDDTCSGPWVYNTYLIDRDICYWDNDWSIGIGCQGKMIFNTGLSVPQKDSTLVSSQTVNSNTWRHVVVVRDAAAGIKKIFIDGRLAASQPFANSAFTNNSLPIIVGASNCMMSSHRFYKGDIDDIKIYNIALSPNEVLALTSENNWPVLRLNSPNGGEQLGAGSTYGISWLSLNITSVKLEYSTNNGADWLTIASSVNATAGQYQWFVPGTPSAQCLVKISDAANLSIYSVSEAVFTIDFSNTFVPVLSYPNNGLTVYTNSPVLNWYLVTAAPQLSYQLQVASDSSFSSIVFDLSDIPVCYQLVSGLLSGHTYYSRVRSVYGGSVYSAWSAIEHFRIFASANPVPLTPVFSWPNNGVSIYLTSININWYLPAPAVLQTYNLQVSMFRNMSSPFVDEDNISVIYYPLSGLSPGQMYYMRIRAHTPDGLYSNFSAVDSFRVDPGCTGPAIPILSYPTDGVIVYTVNPDIRWYINTGAPQLLYNVQLSSNPDFTSILLNADNINTQYYNVTGLQFGTTYYSRVRSRLAPGVGAYSAWSNFGNFTIYGNGVPVSPIPSSPIRGVTISGENPQLSWMLPASSNGLLFKMTCTDDTVNSSSWRVLDNINTNFCYLTSPIPMKKYYWRVASYNQEGQISAASPWAYFNMGSITGIKDKEENLSSFNLLNCYPNPFNPSTAIQFSLPEDGTAKLEVSNSIGQRVAVLADGILKAGAHEITFYAGDLPSGVYFVTLRAGKYIASKKLVLIK